MFVDEQAERTRAGILIAAFACFLISGWYSFNELNYALRGHSVEANVLRMFEYTVPTRHGQSRPRLGIQYSFTDKDQQPREGQDWMPLPSPLQGVQTVPVQYLSGKSRLASNHSYFGPTIFVICLATLVLSLFRLIREANAPIPRQRRKTMA